MKEVRHLYTTRQVNDILGMRNGPNTSTTLNLPLQSKVRIWREKEKQSGPYQLIAIDSQTCTIQMPHGPTQFCPTVIKPYYKDNSFKPLQDAPKDTLEENYDQCAPEGDDDSDTIVVNMPQP